MSECKLKGFQQVLVRDSEEQCWNRHIFDFYDETSDWPYYCIGMSNFKYCIPYDGNEHLAGTTDGCVEPYVPQNGDFVTFVAYVSKIRFTAICERYMNFTMYYHVGTVGRERNEIHLHNAYSLDSRDVVKPATEEEKQLLLSKLHENGKDWDKDNNRICPLIRKGDFITTPRGGILICSGTMKPHNDTYRIGAIAQLCAKGDRELKVFTQKDKEYSRCLDWVDKTRSSTKLERMNLLSKLHEIEKDWDAEKKEIVDLEWKPKEGDIYYYPGIRDCVFASCSIRWTSDYVDLNRLKNGHVFHTKEECQAMCDKLNQAIKDIK